MTQNELSNTLYTVRTVRYDTFAYVFGHAKFRSSFAY